jgi:hypothetical protein
MDLNNLVVCLFTPLVASPPYDLNLLRLGNKRFQLQAVVADPRAHLALVHLPILLEPPWREFQRFS